ncbi:MAG: hypothetical protein IJU12_09740 [Clostridia bacterium]|nr:hypothetical protein [Clostridia bacterium]
MKRRLIFYLLFLLLLMLPTPVPAEEAAEEPPIIEHDIDEYYDPEATRGVEARLPGPAAWTEAEKCRVRENGSVSPSPALEAAFQMLEQGNPFLERYNLITGARVSPYLPAGIPYFMGGRDIETILRNQPDEYVLWYSWQDSVYYRDGVMYFYGLDCVGFVRKVWMDTGVMGFTTATSLLNECEWRHILSGTGHEPQDWQAWPRDLRLGDVLVTSSPGMHMMMLIGTLRQFGYTAEEVPELSAFLDAPLVIHCGVNAAYADRFFALKQTGPWRYSLATVPDGGVTVSLLGADWSSAPHHVHQQLQDTAWYTLPDGTWLTVIDWSKVLRWCWCR